MSTACVRLRAADYRGWAVSTYIDAMSESEPQGPAPRPVVLCILDGWGVRAESDDNAIALAATPAWDQFMAECPNALLDAAAGDVGLPAGQMGNSEVGHMNIGAGRVVVQDLVRIDAALADGSLARSPVLGRLAENLKASGGTCHLIGLLSPGGVHAHQDHMAALARIVAQAGVPVAVHTLLDGRDTPPKSAIAYVKCFLDDVAGLDGVSVATVGGRYYAMDRDRRWERVERAYRTLVAAEGKAAATALAAIEQGYAGGLGDEFIVPTPIDPYAGMKDGDGILMANFRADRVRQILGALADPRFDGFSRRRTVDFAGRAGMVEYSADLNHFFEAVLPLVELDNILGQLVADAGKTQLRLAETEKYAHVTFFLNGGRERVFPGEERILVPSPKVATYDLAPAMSAAEVTAELVGAIRSGRFDLIAVNYANGDMVGHTGDLDAARLAAETVDACLAQVAAAVTEAGGALLITSDHGNAEMMRDAATGQPHTAHTLNPVPLILVNAPPWVRGLGEGRLADVAPTVLRLMGLARPDEMTGRSLVIEDGVETAAAQ